MDFDWKSLVKTVAPAIASTFGTPLLGLGVRAVAEAILGTPDATQDEVAAALAVATPDQIAALKRADHEFAVRMRELDIDLEKLHQQDRASARDREARTGDSATPRLLALLVTGGFFGVLYWMLRHGLPVDSGGEAMLVMLGSLGTAWIAIVNYYFGSSAGSAEKTRILTMNGNGK
jgi:hypothetical protein